MAFLNLFRNGTYSTIGLHYDKQARVVTIHIRIWEDSRKLHLITELPYMLSGTNKHCEVVSMVSSLPDTANVGDSFLIINPSEDLQERNNQVATYYSEEFTERLGGSRWSWSFTRPKEIVYVKDQGKHFHRIPAAPLPDVWEEAIDVFDCNTWDKWFRPELIGGVDAEGNPVNIMSQIYTYLKTRKEFANVVDA